MQKTRGTIGFSIPVQTLTSSKEVKLIPAEIRAWQKRLPSDLGQSAKKIYHTICDCNKVDLEPKDRFEILELIGHSVQYICQSLSKHYINQSDALTTQQLTIANLAETLHEQMADGYKLVVEQSANTSGSPIAIDSKILSVALHKIIQHLTQIILISYEFYSIPPKGVWKELHLAYQYAEKKFLLHDNNLENEYKRVLILAATCPYQRRQNEQTAVFQATAAWSNQIVLREDLPNTSEPGFLVIDFEQDNPPIFLERDLIKFSSSCKILDVHSLSNHLKTLLAAIEPNELQARINHHHDPEYAVSSAVLRGILKGWEMSLIRLDDRASCDKKVQISIGFLSTHFYLNDQQPFQQQSSNDESESFSLTFSTSSFQEEGLEMATPLSTVDTREPEETTEAAKMPSYPLYPCTLINENPNGYGLLWAGNTSLQMQSGEIIGLAMDDNGNRTWEACTIRWLLHLTEGDFKIGVERLSKTATAAAVQLIKNGKPSGYCARCFILESTLLVPSFPFKTGSHVLLISDNKPSLEVELKQLTDSTGTYQQFQYVLKHKPTDPPLSKPTTSSFTSQKGSEKGDDIFDTIWPSL